MIELVKIDKKLHPQNFLKYLSLHQRKEVKKLSSKLKEKKIVHINATPVGGGVAEIMRSFIPYTGAFDMNLDWYVLKPSNRDKFFGITNKLHNALQGLGVVINDEEWEIYKSTNKEIASDLDELNPDLLVVHDPQPCFAPEYMKTNQPRIYYNHIDTSAPNPDVWNRFYPALKNYDAYIFSNRDFVNEDLPNSKVNVFTPAIDPFTLKQKVISQKKAREYLKDFGVPEEGELILQVSRFDVWKNPAGLINAFKKIKDTHPNAILALVGLKEAKDNPEAERAFNEVRQVAGGDKRILLFFDPGDEIKNISEFTMYFQNAADIVVQNSIKEGFGLTVSEAMWKRKPVIGGPASGIKRQIKDGKNGYIANDDDELAKRLQLLLSYKEKRTRMGKRAKAYVTKHFLFPRLVLDHLKIYNKLIKNSK